MKIGIIKRSVAFLLCSVALAFAVDAAVAKPLHKKPHRQQAVQASAQADLGGVRDNLYAVAEPPTRGSARKVPQQARRHSRAVQQAAPVSSGFNSSSLVSEARKYLGTNPTGRRSLWCGAFMDMVLKRTGHAGGGNLASAYARYGARVSGPQVGAIAVMRRGGGGHVGVVAGVDPNGNPIIISGNHNNTVAESVYPRGRIVAYVLPNG
jgi:uncharacterized protein (TIGR02594 family)